MKVLILDIEATCSKNNFNYTQEIIEFGFCICDNITGEISDKTSILVKPEKSYITKFCTELTGITRKMINDEGVSFEQACNKLKKYKEYPWMSWSTFDLEITKRQCIQREIEYPLNDRYTDIQAIFSSKISSESGYRYRPISLRDAIYYYDLEFEGKQHRASDDAYNTAKVYSCIKK